MVGRERQNKARITIAHYGDVKLKVVDAYSVMTVRIEAVDGPIVELFLNNDDPQISAAWKRLDTDLAAIQALKDSA